VIFILAVLFPSLILSYIGLHSVRQEQIRQESAYLQALEHSLALAASRVESEVEDRLQTILNNLPVYGMVPGGSFMLQLRSVVNHSPLVEEVFLLDRDARILYPRKFPDRQTGWQQLSEQDQYYFSLGVAYEARDMPEEAIRQYRMGLGAAGCDLGTMTLINAIARCHLKLNQYRQARSNFREVINLDRGRFLGGEVPFVLLAYHQLCGIESSMNSPAEALDLRLDFFEFLVNNFQYLQKAQHDFYISGLREQIEAALAGASQEQAGRHKNIIEMKRAAEAERAFRNFFDKYLLSVSGNFLQLSGGDTELNYFRIQAGEHQLLVAMKVSADELRPEGLRGIVLDEEKVISTLFEAAESYAARSGLDVFLFHSEGNFQELSENQENPPVTSAGLGEVQNLLPFFRLGIDSGGGTAFGDIQKRTLALYYSVFAAIIGVTFFGIVFIFRDIYRERQFSQLRSSFISNVSHEIKTPVTTLKVLAGNLAEGLIHKPDRKHIYYRLITREAEKLSYLTENILDFSSVEARQKVYRKEMINLYDLLQEVVRRFYLMHQEKKLVIHKSIPSNHPEVRASAEGIEQAVLNLLDNAVKYSGEEKNIWLSLSHNHNEVTISVMDKGIGIARTERQKVFEKFYRVQHKGQHVPGSGIGLSLVREIAQLHNGRVELESEPGKGSKFSLIIPVNDEKDPADRR